MLTISKPLSSGQAQTYHAKEFTSAEQNYWRHGDTILGEWHGKLAGGFGLVGAVGADHFGRLAEGQHPHTAEQLVRHHVVQEYEGVDGKAVAPAEHRAGWDATFSAPKSVSLTALVGGDDRVREAHRKAVDVALDELERYTQARIGGNHAAETTGLCQGNEHLPAVQLRRPHVVLHDRIAAREPVLCLEPLEDPLRCVPLLGRPPLVIFQNGVDHTQPRPQLGPPDRLLPLIAWRHREPQHLAHCLPRQPKLPGHRSLTPALHTYRSPYTPVYLHLEHPSGVPSTMPSRQ